MGKKRRKKNRKGTSRSEYAKEEENEKISDRKLGRRIKKVQP
jgi:hypothetical protein